MTPDNQAPARPSEPLLPCPFCGGEPMLSADDLGGAIVVCLGCRIRFSEEIEQRRTVIAAWNQRRAADPRAAPADAFAVIQMADFLLSRMSREDTDALENQPTDKALETHERLCQWIREHAKKEDPRPAAVSQWIACSERMPEPGRIVLACWVHDPHGPTIDCVMMDSVGRWCHLDVEGDYSIPTHWMPLPAPAKEMT